MSLSFKYQDETINIGDTIRVHQQIKEDDKVRTQVFEGLVIAIKGREVNKSYTVRKIGHNSIGVEKIFPILSPNVTSIEIKSRGKVRRSKLYYLRDRVGRRALRVKENRN